MLRSLLCFLIVLFCMPVRAAEKPYLTHEQLDIITFLPKPVANGSEEDKAQQALVIAVQKAASAERIALANSDSEETVYAMFGRVMGDRFKPELLPLTTQLFSRLGETEDAVVDPVKAHFGRIRPFLNNPEIRANVKPSKSGAYPSGHTSRSKMMAIILAVMVPEYHDVIFERAEDYAFSRIVGGMHYPNDLEGGRIAGTAMAATLLADTQFRQDVQSAKSELRKVLGL